MFMNLSDLNPVWDQIIYVPGELIHLPVSLVVLKLLLSTFFERGVELSYGSSVELTDAVEPVT
jgi:hypothetical protein